MRFCRLCRLNYQFQIYSYVTPGKDTGWSGSDGRFLHKDLLTNRPTLNPKP